MSALAGHHPASPTIHHDPAAAAIAVAQEEARHAAALKQERRRVEGAWLTGRLVLGGVFMAQALIKLATFDQTRAMLETQQRAAPAALVTLAIVVELFGGALLATGWTVRRTAIALGCWVGVVTLFMHWNLGDAANRTAALSNLGVLAALTLLGAHGGGRSSVDAAKVREQVRAELS